ncbi:unnamed protein product, partial [Ectocarpus sp. 12 AP-2014]
MSTIPFTGRSDCLDAFIVALNQACDGQNKRWIASTLELQLASLEFCGACRSVQTFQVHVDAETPPRLWYPCKAHITPDKEGREVSIASRVPAVQPFGWTWSLRSLKVEVLLQTSVIDPRSRPECRRLPGPSSAASLGCVGWLQKLERLVFASGKSVNTVLWPASLQQLSFGDVFNQPIVGIVWPASLQRLEFGREFNQAVLEAVWPVSLQQLSFGREFNQAIIGTVWPVSLQQLSFGREFNQAIIGTVWPVSLQQLSFGREFNQAIIGTVWPVS